MRTSKGGPMRTVMMIVPLIVVAVLASMGGYHYRTVVASQGGEEPSANMPDDAVVLGTGVGESAKVSTEELFADFPDDASFGRPADFMDVAQDNEAAPVNEVANEDENLRPREPRPSRDETRRLPKSATAGWQFADADSSENEPTENHSAASEESLDDFFEDEKPVARRPGQSDLQTEIDARQRKRNRPNEKFFEKEEIAETDNREIKKPHTDDATKKVSDNSRRNRQPRTLKEAALKLRDMGIRKYRLEMNPDDGSYRFRCAVTEINNPSVRRRFEAVGNEPLATVRKVLRQIEEWRAQE